MRHYKQLSDDYLTAIGTGPGGEEITEAEYNHIMSVVQNRPKAEGKGYRLKTDLTWEEYDLPPEPEPEPGDEDETEDMRAALKLLGVTVTEETA